MGKARTQSITLNAATMAFVEGMMKKERAKTERDTVARVAAWLRTAYEKRHQPGLGAYVYANQIAADLELGVEWKTGGE